jgi:3-hydroxyisobutyrate dehydrogenase
VSIAIRDAAGLKESETFHMHVGIAGTGRMGTAIAKRLIGLGHAVTVWNRTSATADAAVAAGAARAASPAALAGAVDILITILTDAAAVEAVYAGPQGILSAPLGGRVVIDMTTARPEMARGLAPRVAAAGGAFVECPVGGSVIPASEGKLIGFVGGAQADVARARPLLELLCRRVEHLGPAGAGASMKLAINLPLMVYWQALGESLALIDGLGLDSKRIVDILSDTSGGPNMLKTRGPAIAQAIAQGHAAAVSVDVATMRKDLRSMLAEGASLGVQLPVTAQALACFDRAAAAGEDGSDCTRLPVWWARSGGRAAAS